MAYTWSIADLPVITPPVHRSAALLDQLTRRMRHGTAVALEPFGLRPRHLITLTVLRDAGPISQQDLAATLRIDRTNLVGLLNDLETAGLVERRRSAEDRRRHDVDLTSAGRRTLAKAEFALAAVEGEVLGALDDEQREQLFGLLQLATRACVPGATRADDGHGACMGADDPAADDCDA